MDQMIVPTFTLQIVGKGTMLGFVGTPIERLKILNGRKREMRERRERKRERERERERKVRINEIQRTHLKINDKEYLLR